MIEYTGYISGTAQKYCEKISRRLVLKALSIAFLTVLPTIIILALAIDNWGIIVGYLFVIAISIGCLYLPKKNIQSFLPKKITIDTDYIVSITDHDTASRSIDAVQTVLDFGDFYVINFCAGQKSDRFICQKNLLSKGTDDAFRNLFKAKIRRKTGSTD